MYTDNAAPITYTEQAVLGAMLIDAAQVEKVKQILTPDDFWHPSHGPIFQALVRQAVADPPASQVAAAAPADWPALIYQQVKAHPDVRGLTAVDLFTMMERTPHAGHALTYAYKVLEESARRQIVAIASRAEQVLATVEGHPLPERLDLLGDQRKALAGLVDNWRGGTGNTPELLEQAARTAGSGLPPPEPAALAREDQLLASLIASGSDTVASVKPWLRPDDFQAPGRGGIYQALLDLHQRGEPIDPITVMWEAHHKGVLATRGGLDAKSLLDVARTQRVPFPLNQAQQVSQQGARRALLASFRGLKGLASGNTAWDLLVSATRHNLATARAEHTRIIATRTVDQVARPVNTPTRPVHLLPRR